MILSPAHRFVFLKVPKAAGSSVEVVLSKVAGPDAIVTPLHPPEAGHGPRNFRRPVLLAREALEAAFLPPSRRSMGTPHRRRAAVRQVARRVLHQEAFWSHMTAAEVRRRVGAEVWDSSFTFCFVRNPWDQVVSQYWWFRSVVRGRPPHFDEFVLHSGAVRSVWPIFAGKHGVEVDFVGRYEQLERDLAHVLHTVGIEAPFELPRAKGGLRGRTQPRWSRATSERVKVVFAREIDQFGYEVPDWVTGSISA